MYDVLACICVLDQGRSASPGGDRRISSPLGKDVELASPARGCRTSRTCGSEQVAGCRSGHLRPHPAAALRRGPRSHHSGSGRQRMREGNGRSRKTAVAGRVEHWFPRRLGDSATRRPRWPRRPALQRLFGACAAEGRGGAIVLDKWLDETGARVRAAGVHGPVRSRQAGRACSCKLASTRDAGGRRLARGGPRGITCSRGLSHVGVPADR